MLPAFSLTRNRTKCTLLLFFKRFYRYYVVLPEVPKCSVEDNILLKAVQNGDFPPLKSVSTKDAYEATAKLALDFEGFSAHHAESFEDARKEKTFQTVFEPLNEDNVQLDFAFCTLRQKMLTQTKITSGTEWVDMRIQLQGMYNLIRRCTNVQFTSESFYRAVKEVAADKFKLDDRQKRLADYYIAEGKLKCVEYRNPVDKALYEEFCKKIIMECQGFWLNTRQSCIEADTKAEAVDLADLPNNYKYLWSKKAENIFTGPYAVSLDTKNYNAFMKYCRHPLRRYNLWYYWNNRASFREQVPLINNSLKITEIREFRHEVAKVCGFESFSELSLSTKMANSLDEVDKFITLLREKCSKKFQKRSKEMQSFAEISDQIGRELQPWDYDYYARKLVEFETKLSSNEISRFFPFKSTWNNLLALVERIFGLKFVQVQNRSKLDLLDDTIQVFCAVDAETGREKGYLYFDPFVRSGKQTNTWVDGGRALNKQLNYSPIVYLNADVCPNSEGECLLSLEQLCLLSECLGKALVHLLCDCPYYATYSWNGVERDGSFVFGEVLKWIVLEPTVLRRLSDDKLGKEEAENVRRIYVESSFSRLMEDVFLSEFDLTMHKIKMFWNDLWKHMYQTYYSQPPHRDHNFPCSFTSIMNEGNAAAYYSRLWSDMVACDIVSAFRDVGFENETALAAVGKTYKETYLTIGGARKARDVFKLFRNRDLEFDHIGKFYNLD